MKKICIAFLGNAFNDTRVTNLTNSLIQDSCKVNVISFDWTSDSTEDILGDISVYKLDKSTSSIKFYLSFLSILRRSLSKVKADIYIAEDVYTLPLAVFFAKLRGKKVYYNCRELYPFLAGLRNKRVVQNIIKFVERSFIKRVDLVLTTGEMDAQFIQHYYKITNTLVIRNLPIIKQPSRKVALKQKFGIPAEHKILLYQGVIFEGRGIDKVIIAIKYLPNVHLILLGDGVKKSAYQKLADDIGVSLRVHFAGTASQDDLINYTVEAEIGLALIENISLSYYYALPNKLFEYIAAGVPVLSSNLPQMKLIVDKYKVGRAINIDSNETVAKEIKSMLEDGEELETFKQNAKTAAAELNWDVEYSSVRSKLLG